MFSLLRNKPLIDQDSTDWIFEAYSWALDFFDKQEFFTRTRLIQPTNEFFPGDVNSVHAKAQNIFQHTLNYTGLSHWPFELQAPEQFQNQSARPLHLVGIVRHSGDNTMPALSSEEAMHVSYNPQQTLKPGDMSSTFAHLIAQHLVVQSQQLPPGGADYFIEGTELLAVFMGFGVLFANSAYTFRGGCGSCYNAQANRQGSLSEEEVVFALALFCRLKDISNAEATPYLKKHLRVSFKKALKQLNSQPQELKLLMDKKQDLLGQT